MGGLRLLGLGAVFWSAIQMAHANVTFKPPINWTLEHAVEAECKTCPYSLCTNKAWYSYNTNVTLTCWTKGTSLANDTLWLQTSDECYVSEMDLKTWNGTFEKDLSFCGPDSRQKHLTYDSSIVKYDGECNICPDYVNCETISYLGPGTELTTTCWTDLGESILNNPTWVKTTNNCYVPEANLEDPANKDILDYCGPIGFIQVNYTGELDQYLPPQRRKAAPQPIPIPSELKERNKQMLINITVGEDWAICYTCTNITTCEEVKRYPFNHSVFAQCGVTVDTYTGNGTADFTRAFWYQTTDWCFVRDADFFESIEDYDRFAPCDRYTKPTRDTVEEKEGST